MEFIPLERYSNATTKKKRANQQETESDKIKKLKKNEEEKDPGAVKVKRKPQVKVIEKKNVKNKYRETLALKNKKRVPKRKVVQKHEQEEDESVVENVEDVEETEKEEDEDESEEGEESEVHNQNMIDEDEEEALKKKCQELDEKKKNRLFVKFKKKIYNEAQVKELHPDIRSVIFPRKKKSRWCWAVFTSEEKADQALKKLVKNKEVFVTKPNPYEKVLLKRKEKMKTVLRKKEARKKLQKMWM